MVGFIFVIMSTVTVSHADASIFKRIAKAFKCPASSNSNQFDFTLTKADHARTAIYTLSGEVSTQGKKYTFGVRAREASDGCGTLIPYRYEYTFNGTTKSKKIKELSTVTIPQNFTPGSCANLTVSLYYELVTTKIGKAGVYTDVVKLTTPSATLSVMVYFY